VAVTGSGDLQNQIMPVTITAATDRCAFGHIASAQPMNVARAVR
jgi:threonylcarbamoyladenosine tRNA methylthiotransferase MtaB